jgi:photosystem II stability/assembly factor-like uncharacterized protein
VNTIKELRQALAEEATRLQPAPGLEERILQSALPSRAGVAALTPRSGVRDSVRSWDSRSIEDPRLTAIVAALLAVAIVAGLLLTGRALHLKSSSPADQGPTQFHAQACRTQCEVSGQQPLQPKFDAPRQCVIGSANCQIQAQFFANPTVGWITYYVTGPSAETYLFRTEDAGQHWRSVLSWDGSHEPIVVSGADGKEVLVVSACCAGASIFHSTDGGVHWAAYGLPAGAEASFFNPREGWATIQDAQLRPTVLFRTADSGAHWIRIARLEWSPNGEGRSFGVFTSSSFGFFTRTGTLYLTHDGGATWGAVLGGRPEQIPASATFVGMGWRFFNTQDGVLMSAYCGEPSCGALDIAYAYGTSDGGAHWSEPVRLPTDAAGVSRIIFIDPNHWIAEVSELATTGYSVRRVIHTSDAGQHWTVLVAPADPNGYLTDWDQFGAIQFTDPMHGFAFTGGPDLNQPVTSLRMTNDGGVTWTIVPLPASIVEANTGKP